MSVTVNHVPVGVRLDQSGRSIPNPAVQSLSTLHEAPVMLGEGFDIPETPVQGSHTDSDLVRFVARMGAALFPNRNEFDD